MNSIGFSENLKKLRMAKGWSKSELGKRVGVSDVTIGYWESGKTEPRMGKVEMVADVLGVTTDELLFSEPVDLPTQPAKNITMPVAASNRAPLYGSVAAGIPLEMHPVNDFVEIPLGIATQYPHAFLLRINGDSMNKIVPHGAYALIDPCENVSNGEIAAVIVDNDEATLKRFFRLQNSIALEPDSCNPDHSVKIIDASSGSSVKIIGKLVWFMAAPNVKF
ncbi:helix-turn-helix domain-containing protein [Paenibacillus albicereus]|uniref:Helix-turn-helix domain-containing protein n=1 Tax=Paenibacillus albicereus TaxID=2726185 RepID=A0A6H2H0A0_9BACL|nr:XRE family transcriptional regulator [Paenibacillus albicereus]QJC53085.1 helix-turn-helix domain-containing protein [Paenibacillus albicereus]